MVFLTGATATMGFDAQSGAVNSLVCNGFQYVNADDKGRLIQTAYSYDGQGEAQNPTEGVSKLASVASLAANAHGGPGIVTSAQLGYWRPFNGQTLSPDTITKKVRVDWARVRGVFKHNVAITVAAPHQTVTIEGLTGYVNMGLSSLYSLANGKLKALPYTAGAVFSQSLVVHSGDPLVMATPDAQHAMGVYSPLGGYWAWMGAGGDCNKWDAAEHSMSPVKAGVYSWDVYYSVGTLAQVSIAIQLVQLIIAAEAAGIMF